MLDEHALTLQQIDKARGDLYAIADDLGFLKPPTLAPTNPRLFLPHAVAGDREHLAANWERRDAPDR